MSKFKIVVKNAFANTWGGDEDDLYEDDTDLEFFSSLIYVIQEYPDNKIKITINGKEKESN